MTGFPQVLLRSSELNEHIKWLKWDVSEVVGGLFIDRKKQKQKQLSIKQKGGLKCNINHQSIISESLCE